VQNDAVPIERERKVGPAGGTGQGLRAAPPQRHPLR